MRWLLVTILLRVVTCAEPDAGPLLDRSVDRDQVVPALMALSRGEVAAFTALPAELFIASAGVVDHNDPDLVRHWTSAVPIALARLSDSARINALAALDQHCRLLLETTSDAATRARIASAFLPAPSAMRTLVDEANRAFDHGDFRRYLAIATLTANDDPRRTDTAMALLGAGPDIDPATALSAPGLPIPTSATLPASPIGLGVRWRVTPGWLLALDPWGAVRWQYRLDSKADVIVGDGGALIRDGRGLRLISENGEALAMPPAPESARMLTVAGGAAWFATGTHIHRLEFADRHLTTFTLPTEPLAAPLVRGADSLWLTRTELVLVHGTTAISRIDHSLAATSGWTLGIESDQPLIVSNDGTSWHVEALASQLAQAPLGRQLDLLIRANRSDEALTLYASEPALATDPICRHLALIASLTGDTRQIQANGDRILALATNPQDQSIALTALHRDADLAALSTVHPNVLIPRGDSAVTAQPETWNHVLTGRAWAEREGFVHWLTIPASQRMAIGDPQKNITSASPVRQGDGSWLIGTRRVRCDASLAYTTLECRDIAGDLLWRHRWAALDPLAAPGRALALRDGWIVLIEGAAIVRIIDGGNGDVVSELPLHGADLVPATVIPLSANSIADLGPLGLDTVLHLRSQESTVDIQLPTAARWLIPWGDHVLVALNDGRFLAYPGGTTVLLPNAFQHGPAPMITHAGLEIHGSLWPWTFLP